MRSATIVSPKKWVALVLADPNLQPTSLTLSKCSIASIAIEHGPFVDDLPKDLWPVFFWFSMAVFNDQTSHPTSGMPLSTFNGVRKVLFLHLLTFTALLMAMPKLASLHPVFEYFLHILLTKNGGPIGHALIRKMANNCRIPSFSRTKKTKKSRMGVARSPNWRYRPGGNVGGHHSHIHTALHAISHGALANQQPSVGGVRLVSEDTDLASAQGWRSWSASVKTRFK